MDFEAVFAALSRALQAEGIDFALIGGLALAARGVPRGTADLDFLVPGERANDLDRVMRRLGYVPRLWTENVANYAAGDPRLGHVDFLFARRPYSRAMLAQATCVGVQPGMDVKVVQTEDLIGLKVQSSSNDPGRLALDMADIEALLATADALDLARVREYFRVFGREAELEAILDRIGRR